jgi:hypothetical protein
VALQILDIHKTNVKESSAESTSKGGSRGLVDTEEESSTKWSNIKTEFILQVLLIAGENLG